jgi:hypothetical protein
MRTAFLSLSLFWIAAVASVGALSSCSAIGQLDAPSIQAIKADALTFDAVAPAVMTFIAADLQRPITQRATPPQRSEPMGRSDVELGNILGLLDDWQFRLKANAAAAGLELDVELPAGFSELRASIASTIAASAGGSK